MSIQEAPNMLVPRPWLGYEESKEDKDAVLAPQHNSSHPEPAVPMTDHRPGGIKQALESIVGPSTELVLSSQK